MRSSRPSRSLCRPAAAKAVGLALVSVTALGAPSATSTASATLTTGDAGPSIAPSGVSAGATAVPPRIHELRIPAVATAHRAAATAKLSGRRSTAAPVGSKHSPLVAHLRRPLMHPFSLVGVTWAAGTAAPGTTISMRAHSHGSWSNWTPLSVDPEEGPSPAEDSSARPGTDPAWVGDATGVEVAVYSPDGSTPQSLAVSAIDPGTSSYDGNAKTLAPAAASTSTTSSAGTFPGMPDIITRREWGADPSLGDPCWEPRYGDTFSMVFVHHTAGSNNYSESESAAVVRGVYAYHTQSRGWCDIGYNFLVDRYGNIYEGRRGGMILPVRGAHAGDYNVDTTGISLMGDFTSTQPTRAMKHALVQLIAWRMGTAYHGAYGHPLVNGKRFNRISGHRDAMSTSCPGQVVYDWLPTLRERVATRLGDYMSPIEARWRRMGGTGSRLGTVSIGEQPENGGHHTTFQGGRMYDSRDGGTHAFYQTPILDKYRSYGGTASALGYPYSGVRSIAGGLTAEFAGGRIFYSAATPARVLVRSVILRRYLALGSAEGRLGFPTSSIHETSTGTIAHFQHGSIERNSVTHTTVVTYS